MKKPVILLSLILVVFLAGCVGTKVGSGTQGVIITSFSPDTTTTETGINVTFTLVVENKGEQSATGVVAQLFGLSPDWNQQAITFPSSQIPTTLQGADVSGGMPGEMASGYVTVTPIASKATDTTYDANVRVAYTYRTISESLLRVATSDYVKSITPPGGQSTQTFGIISSKTTSGPLTVNVKTRTATIPPGTTQVSLSFEIQNVGGGRTFDGTVTMTPAINNLDQIDWSGACSGGGKLVGAKSRIITCTITLPSFTNFVEIPVKLQIDYNYFVDSSTSVTVLKTLSGITPGTGTPSTTPSLIVSASPSSVAAGATFSTITAQTSDNVAGKTVSFTTTRGTFLIVGTSPLGQCTTDSSGKCYVGLSSIQTGAATVTASSTGYTPGSIDVTFT